MGFVWVLYRVLVYTVMRKLMRKFTVAVMRKLRKFTYWCIQ